MCETGQVYLQGLVHQMVLVTAKGEKQVCNLSFIVWYSFLLGNDQQTTCYISASVKAFCKPPVIK